MALAPAHDQTVFPAYLRSVHPDTHLTLTRDGGESETVR